MRSLYSTILSFVCVLLALDGCNTAPVAMSSRSFVAPLSHVEPLDPSFMLGLGILSGFDEPRQAASWQPDDWILLGVKVATAAESDVWFVRLSTLEEISEADELDDDATPQTREFAVPFGVGVVKSGTKFTAPVGRMLIETFDSQGELLRSSVRSVPRMSPAASLLDIWRMQPDQTGVSRSHVASTMMMLHALGTSRAVRPIRDAVRSDVIKKPKILGLLLNGLRISVEAEISETELVQTPWSADAALSPRHEVQFPLCLTGQKMFDCRMVVGPSNPPYSLLGGTLLFEAVHPDKPQNRMTVRVLAAKHVTGSDSGTLVRR